MKNNCARSVSDGISKYSLSLCWYPPIGPNPSTVAVPTPAVKEASEPPPVETSSKSSVVAQLLL
ncbi:hypothetical protein AB6F62_08895 [Providencia huaxiensis]